VGVVFDHTCGIRDWLWSIVVDRSGHVHRRRKDSDRALREFVDVSALPRGGGANCESSAYSS
jgi:hypothetical protein